MKLFRKKSASVVETKNWYADRYQNVVVQRNILFLMTFIAFFSVLVAVFVVMKVSTSKSIEPFVIEVEKTSGITNVVRPFLKEKISENDALRDYFAIKYLNARETYHFFDFEYNYFSVVRIMSSPNVYFKFRGEVTSDNMDSPIRYGDKLERTIKVSAITPIPTSTDPQKNIGQVVQVRFELKESGARGGVYRKIATINYDYQDKKMTMEERQVNPLGFQVLSYVVVDELIK